MSICFLFGLFIIVHLYLNFLKDNIHLVMLPSSLLLPLLLVYIIVVLISMYLTILSFFLKVAT